MSSISDSEQDLGLKLRTMRYLWSLGYYVRRNVLLLDKGSGGKQYTDIDVLAVKIDEGLDSQFLVCDCKSGVQARTRERLFWLKGVMEYFGATSGMFIRTRLTESKYIELGNRLGITSLSEGQLIQLEKAYEVGTGFFGPFSKEGVASEELFSLLRKFNPETADYLRVRYWEDEPPQQIANLVACCKRINAMGELQEKAKDFLITYALSHLALSVVRFAKQVLVVADPQKPEYIRLELLGGKIEHDARRELLGRFYDFMSKEIEARYNSKYPIGRTQFLDSLTPEYAKYLIDMLTRVSQRPRWYAPLPRYMDLFAFESTLSGRSLKTTDLVASSLYIDPGSITKPMIDLLTFANRSGLLTAGQFKGFNEKIQSLS
jgi:hypothetical protein